MNKMRLRSVLKVFGAFLVLCFTVMSGIALDVRPAMAETFDPNATYTFTNENSNKIFDVEFQSLDSGAHVHQSTYYGKWSQQWRIQSTGDGYYEIVNANSGKVADVEGESTSNGAYVIQWDYWGGDNQKWSLEPVGDYYVIRNKNSGKVMDVEFCSTDDFAKIHQEDYISGLSSQLFKIQKINAPLPGIDPAKFYKIRAYNTPFIWDVYGSSTGVMKIQLYDDHNGDNQKWQIVPFGYDGNPSFTIMNKNSGYNAAISPSSSDGTTSILQQWSPNQGSDHWVFEQVSPGIYKIRQWASYSQYIYGMGDLMVNLTNSGSYGTYTLELAN